MIKKKSKHDILVDGTTVTMAAETEELDAETAKDLKELQKLEKLEQLDKKNKYIVKSGDISLALDIEKEGYKKYTKANRVSDNEDAE